MSGRIARLFGRKPMKKETCIAPEEIVAMTYDLDAEFLEQSIEQVIDAARTYIAPVVPLYT